MRYIKWTLEKCEKRDLKGFLIYSDVKGLTKIVKPGISGDFFQSENEDHLAEKITYYLGILK